MTATAAQPMTAADILREVAARQIVVVPAFDGKVWTASVDVKGTGHNRKRAIRSVSAIAASPTLAVAALVRRLDGEAQERELTFDPYDY